MIDGTVVVIAVEVDGEAALVEIDGEVAVKTEEEDIGEVAEEEEDIGEVVVVAQDGEEEPVETGEEGADEEDVMEGVVPLLISWMMMTTWESLTWAAEEGRDSESLLSHQRLVVVTLPVAVTLPSNPYGSNSRGEGRPSVFSRLDKESDGRLGRGGTGSFAFSRLSGLGGSSSRGPNWHKVTVSPYPWTCILGEISCFAVHFKAPRRWESQP